MLDSSLHVCTFHFFQNMVLVSLAVWDMTSVVHQDQCVVEIVYVYVTQLICTSMGIIVLIVS